MTIRYNLTGKDRKKLVTAISRELGSEAIYLGTPSYAYTIGSYSIDRDGTLTGSDNRELVNHLCGLRFFGQEEFDERLPWETATDTPDAPTDAPETPAAASDTEPPEETPAEAPASDIDQVAIEVPLEGFAPESIDNLCKLVLSKEVLIKKALGAEELPIQVLEDRISFPWFKAETDGAHITAYAQFITALTETAKTKARVTAKPQDFFENEKFAMRVWLIGLGLVGKEYGAARKLMMANLGGNSGHRYDAPDRAAAPARERIPDPIINETPEQKAKRELMQLWGNTDKRREFIKSHREWGVWLTVPELGLVYYRYELPDGGRILAMEYQSESHYTEGLQTYTTYYLWDGEHFTPHSASEYIIIERLKNLKAVLHEELRSEAAAAAAETAPDSGEGDTLAPAAPEGNEEVCGDDD